MNAKEKRNQIAAMLYQNMKKPEADETLMLIDELCNLMIKSDVVYPIKCNCIHSGSCIYEQVVLESGESCRYREPKF